MLNKRRSVPSATRTVARHRAATAQLYTTCWDQAQSAVVNEPGSYSTVCRLHVDASEGGKFRHGPGS